MRKSSMGLVISNSILRVSGFVSFRLTLESGAALMTAYMWLRGSNPISFTPFVGPHSPGAQSGRGIGT